MGHLPMKTKLNANSYICYIIMYYSPIELKQPYHKLRAKNWCPNKEANQITIIYLIQSVDKCILNLDITNWQSLTTMIE